MTNKPDVLVIAAHALELAPFHAALESGHGPRGTDLRVATGTIGVGMARAGGEAARQLARLQPRCAVLLGSCGIYPSAAPRAEALGVVLPRILELTDGATCMGWAAIPEPMRSRITLNEPLVNAVLACNPARAVAGSIATTLGITTDDAHGLRLAAHSACDGENMEAFAVAEACMAAEVPFFAAFGVTNTVGSQGRQQWLKYRDAAARAAAEVVVAWLIAEAPGLTHASPPSGRTQR